MNNFQMFITNKYIYVPLCVWAIVQIFKFVYEFLKTKKVDFRRLMGAGGMPSAHTAVVVSLTTLLGKELTVASPIFAVSLVFSIIVMYDAAGVRRAAGKQAKLLNRLVETPGLTNIQVQERLVEVLGHSPKEVIVGAIVGVMVGLIF